MFAQIRGEMIVVFGAGVLPRGTRCDRGAFLVAGGLGAGRELLSGAAGGLALFQRPPSQGETFFIYVDASGENWASTSSLSPEGAPPSC